jgi:hypothetical protein
LRKSAITAEIEGWGISHSKLAAKAAGFFVVECWMAANAAQDEPQRQSAIDRARKLAAPFAGDESLTTWAARIITAADDFQKNKRPDPLGGFLVTHLR